ncbi:unnamed protein product [Phytophthora lilii]|uniref:Unnamed protein product n=1 Tax=Phytophthora lilii TaxID=2077276 RepID=A0A9W6YH92_9STRA|nr:unnamed protein product [Phytophthora lilii]
MVDFNRWITEVLADTRFEGIEWEPSYGENPWLALEQPQGQPANAVRALDDASTVQLLRNACESYIARCDSLQQANNRLVEQLEELKAQLKEALTRAFETQQTLERERELSSLQERRLVVGVQCSDYLARQSSRGDYPASVTQQIMCAVQKLDAVNNISNNDIKEIPVHDSSSLEVGKSKMEVTAASANDFGEPKHPANIESKVTTLDTKDEPVLPRCSDFQSNEKEVQPPSGSADSSVTMVSSSSSSDSFDFQQLANLGTTDEKNGGWYRQALHALKERREQRRLLRKRNGKDAIKSSATSTMSAETTSVEIVAHEPLEFEQLVATRDPADHGEDLTWYRRALQHLKQERKRRASFRSRAESFSSTISIVD